MSVNSGSNNDYNWIEPVGDSELIASLSKRFSLPTVIAQILVNRGLTDPEKINKFLYGKLPDLLDPLTMPGMNKSVDRIIQALGQKDPILIYGDNDVDGMTGAALLTEFFRDLGASPLFFISQPSICRENLIVEALPYALEHQCKLLITVDCGITSAKEIEKITQAGLDVIITDHHEPTEALPVCTAILNPKLPGSTYENREITGVGVAFKLAHGIVNRLVSQEKLSPTAIDLKHYLDLVALGTISDMAPLLEENRIFVRYGIEEMLAGRRVGLAKLISCCGLPMEQLSPNTIASKVAPRLNSLGRIADPTKGTELLLMQDDKSAKKLAQELDLNNIQRQKIERLMAQDVEKQLQATPSPLSQKAILISSTEWHPGIIAIISTRLSRQYNRPTITFAIENGIAKGSIRSITQFPVLKVLQARADILQSFGGHDFAAGVTLKQENLEEFSRYFIEEANKCLSDQDVTNKLYLDAEVNFPELTFDFMEMLHLLEPHGTGNPPPILYTTAKQAWPPRIIAKSHLKLYLEQGERILEGIAFNLAEKAPLLRQKNLSLKVAFTPQVNTFQNKTSIQLIIRDFHIEEPTGQ